jgi:hypothetical protein
MPKAKPASAAPASTSAASRRRLCWNLRKTTNAPLHKFGDHGITVGQVAIDVAKMLARKDKIVDTFTGGIGTAVP